MFLSIAFAASLTVLIGSIDSISTVEARENCKGILPSACACNDRVIDCSNAGINTTEIFLNIPTYYPDLISLNMSGNYFEYLEMDLFNLKSTTNHLIKQRWPLEKLDLSHCRIVGIHEHAFAYLPKLEELILTNNSLSFGGKLTTTTTAENENENNNVGHRIWPTENFLSILSSSLKIIDLSDAFDRLERRTRPTEFVKNLTAKLFNETELKVLQYLNLSSNHITYLPSDAFCRLPVLEYLYLSDNLLHSFSLLDSNCAPILTEIHLRSNYFRRIDDSFMKMIDDRRSPRRGQQQGRSRSPSLRSIFLSDNPFVCDCESQKFIRWVRTTTNGELLADKSQLICSRARPTEYAGKSLIAVPEEKLRCAGDASEYLHGVYVLCAVSFVGLIALLACVFYANRAVLLCKRIGGGNGGRNWMMPMGSGGGYQTLGREPEVKAEMV